MNFFVESEEIDKLYGSLKALPNIRVTGFYTNEPVSASVNYVGKPVLSIYEAAKLYRDNNEVNFIVHDTRRVEFLSKKLNKLSALGVDMADILIASKEFLLTGEVDKLYKFENYHRLPYIEYHVADHCNLNCKGCVHFAPLVDGEIFASLNRVTKDLMQLKSIAPYIDTIRILGGEPLLNPELSCYLSMTRELYPLAEINIVTNGILLQQSNDTLLENLQRYRIGVDISLYPPMFDKIDGIISRLQSAGIVLTISEPIVDFFIPLDQSLGHTKFTNVHHCACPNLYDGAIYVCPVIAYIRYFNKTFGTKLDDLDGRIDIYAPTITFDKLQVELHKVRLLCDSCWLMSREYAARQKWSRAHGKQITDYMLLKSHITSQA